MSALGTLVASVVLDVSQFELGTTKAQQLAAQAATSVDRSFRDMENSVKGYVASIAGAISVGMFVNLINGSIDAMEHLEILTKSTSLTVKELAGLKLLAAESGTDLDGLAKAVDKMTVAMGKSPEKFKELGVTSKDSKVALQQLSDIFASLTDVQQRNALAQTVFSKSWAEVAPVLSMGGKAIGEIIDKGAALSGITAENAERAHKFKAEMAELETTLGRTRMTMVGDLLPALENIAKATQEAADKSGLLMAAWVALGGFWPAVFGMGKAASNVNEMGDEILALQDRIKDLGKERDIAQAKGAPSKGWEVGIATAQTQIDALRLAIRATNGEFQDQVSRMQNQGKGAAAGPLDAARTAAAAAAFLETAKDQKAAYDALIKSIDEKIAVGQAELDATVKLTAAQQFIARTEQAMIEGKVKLTQAQKDNVQGALDELAVIDAERVSRENANLAAAGYYAILSDLDTLHEKSIETTRKLVEKMQDENEKTAFENTLIGKTVEQQKLANIEFERKIALRGIDSPLQIDAINKLYDEKAALTAAGQEMASQVKTWDDLSTRAGAFFGDLVVNGKSAFDRLRQELKNFVQEIIALFAKRYVLSMVAGGSPSTAGAGTLAGTFLGSDYNPFNTGNTSSQGPVQGFSMTANTWGGTDNAWSNAAGGAMMGAGIGSAAAAAWGNNRNSETMSMGGTIGGAIGSIWGPIGSIIGAAIGTAIGSLISSGGGPKQGGSFFGGYSASGTFLGQSGVPGTDNGRFYTPGQSDAQMETIGRSIGTTYFNTIRALGGTAQGLQFGLGMDTDPNGTAPNRISSLVSAAGKTIFSTLNRDIGTDPANIQPQLQLEASRMLLAALKASELPEYLSKVFDGLTPDSATQSQIDTAVQQAESLKAIFDVVSRNPMSDAAQAMLDAQNSFQTALKNNATGIRAAMDAFDHSAASTETLRAATMSYYNAQLNLIIATHQIKDSIDAMFGDTFRNIQLAGMDKQGKYNFYQGEAASLQQQALGSSDPQTIRALANRINDDINAAFALLTPEEQAAQGGAFISQGRATQAAIDTRLESLATAATNATMAVLDQIKDLIGASDAKQLEAANVQKSAAAINLTAAQTPVTLVVTDGSGRQLANLG